MTLPTAPPGRTYGAIEQIDGGWRITAVEPHVAIRLKAVFSSIGKTARPPFVLKGGPQLDADLQWFLARYPLRISETASSQSAAILDPLAGAADQQPADATRIRQLAELYLAGKSHLAAPAPVAPQQPQTEQMGLGL
ncbi:MAG: hypothetical protein RI936_33 [Pseudomonadota bacterium]|jgi:hypothetical protein